MLGQDGSAVSGRGDVDIESSGDDLLRDAASGSPLTEVAHEIFETERYLAKSGEEDAAVGVGELRPLAGRLAPRSPVDAVICGAVLCAAPGPRIGNSHCGRTVARPREGLRRLGGRLGEARAHAPDELAAHTLATHLEQAARLFLIFSFFPQWLSVLSCSS
ncbi:hypothetical protein MTO96_052157 [Rhipicephalus appendiculatus]